MPVYQGKKVTVVRAAKQGDKGFDPAVPKSVIKDEGGTEQTVATADVTE